MEEQQKEEKKVNLARDFSMSPKAAFVMGSLAGLTVMSIVALVLGLTLLRNPSTASTKINTTGTTTTTTTNTSGTGNSLTQAAGQYRAVGNDDHVRGNKNASVTLIEYSDFECPFCKQFAPTTAQILTDYKDKVRLVYRHFPLSFHANAQKEAEASECVAKLSGEDAFWQFHDKIFERTTSNGTGFALTDLGPLAKEIGVSQTKFQDCLDSGEMASVVSSDLNDGTTAGITGTPGTIIVDKNGKAQIIPGAYPFATMKQIIDQALSA